MKVKYSKIIELLIWIHLIMWILVIPVTEFQMIYFGKKIITTFTLGIVEVIVLCIYITLKMSSTSNMVFNATSKLAMSLVVVFMICWFIGLIANPDTALYYKFYYIFYWIMPFIIVVISYQETIDIDKILKFILITSIVNGVMIICQRFSNSLIWPFKEDDLGNTLFYISETYYNTTKMVRCPGICMSGLDSGSLLVFGIVITFGANYLKSIYKFLLSCFFIVCIWFTGTRNVYLLLLFIIGMYIVNIIFKDNKKTRRRISIVLTGMAVLVALLLQLNLNMSNSATRNILTDYSSIGIRMSVWMNILSYISSGSFLQVLTGHSVWQTAGYPTIIDNMYLELLIMNGLLGVIAFCVYLIKLAKIAVNLEKSELIPYYSFVLGMFIYGMLNVIGCQNLSIIMLCAIMFSQISKGECKNENKYNTE